MGFHEPFFYRLVGVLAETMGDVFPEIRVKQKQVEATIRTEEEAFNKTLDRGIQLFQSEIKGAAESHLSRPILSGELAFLLYDTYGFPLDLTELMARERGLTVDVEGFNRLMEEQRDRAEGAEEGRDCVERD